MKLKKNDNVKVMTGRDSGKSGKILSINVEKGTVVVAGVNLYKKHRRPRRQGEKGEIVTVPRPLRASNVRLLCGNCGKAARSGSRMEGEKKIRYCKRCGSQI